MPLVTHTAVDTVGGQPSQFKAVEVTIVTGHPQAHVYRATDGTEVRTKEFVRLAPTDGAYPDNYELELIANTQLVPGGSYYSLRHSFVGDTEGRDPILIVVPDGAGPYRLTDLLTGGPTLATPIIVGFTPAGEYDPDVTYHLRDVVSYDGNSYIARATLTGVLPGTDPTAWQLNASKGNQGEPGAPGGGGGAGLLETTVKTSAYTAAAGELVPADTTGGAFTVTLPAATPGDTVAVRWEAGAVAPTIAAAGTNKIGSGAASTTTLTMVGEVLTLQVIAAGARWRQVSGAAPILSLDARSGLLRVAGAGIDPTGVADSGPAIAALIAARPAGVRRIMFPDGIYKSSVQLNFDATNGISLVAESPMVDKGVTAPVELVYTGTAATFVSAKSSHGFAMHGLSVRYDNTSFTGVLVELQGSLPSPTWEPQFRDCLFGGKGTATGATLFGLDGTVGVDFERCMFHQAAVGVFGAKASGGTGFANVVAFRRCSFWNMVTMAVRNPQAAWSFSDACYFEPLVSGAPGAIQTLDSTVPAIGLSIVGCSFWDIHAVAGRWLDLYGQGVSFQGNRLDLGTAGTGIRLNGVSGVNISGNTFKGSAGAVAISSTSQSFDVYEAGNNFDAGVQRGFVSGRIGAPMALKALINSDQLVSFDTFHRSDNGVDLGMGDDGAGWAQSQRWATTAGKAYTPGTSGAAVAHKSCAYPDGILRVFGKSGDLTYPELVIRAANNFTSYLRVVLDGTDAKLQGYASGVSTDLVSVAYPAYFLTQYLFVVHMAKNRIAVQINGETLLAHTLDAGNFTTFGGNTRNGMRITLTGGAGTVPTYFYDFAFQAAN